MPTGVICNVLAVAAGGAAGALAGRRLSAELREKLNLIFGLCAMGIGFTSVLRMENMPAVVLALILGAAAGVALKLGERIARGGQRLANLVPGRQGGDTGLLVTAIVLFCASGTGIYGTIVSGVSGDHSILLAKSVLDFFTAMIFACTLGPVTALIAVPQAVLCLALFFCARLIPATPGMMNDFRACGGLIMLATGLRVAKIRDFPIAEMIPALVLVWPLSWAWTAWIAPLL